MTDESPQAKQLPIAPLKPHRLDAYEFNNYDNPSYTFGMKDAAVCEALRDIARRIESREYVLQSCGILTEAKRDDYAMTYLTLEFHAKKVSE